MPVDKSGTPGARTFLTFKIVTVKSEKKKYRLVASLWNVTEYILLGWQSHSISCLWRKKMTWNTDCLVAEGTESSLGHHWEAVGVTARRLLEVTAWTVEVLAWTVTCFVILHKLLNLSVKWAWPQHIQSPSVSLSGRSVHWLLAMGLYWHIISPEDPRLHWCSFLVFDIL